MYLQIYTSNKTSDVAQDASKTFTTGESLDLLTVQVLVLIDKKIRHAALKTYC